MNSKNEAQKILYRYLIILIGVSILLGILHCIFGGVRVGRIWWFNLDKERNIATWFSGMLFFLFGCSAFFAYYLEKVRNAKGKSIFKFPWLWLGIGLAGLIMSLDEITILHENIGWRQIRLISENFGTAWIYVTQWQILFAPIIVLILTYFIIVFINRFSFSPRARHNVYIGIACWLIALFFEGIRGIIRVFDRDNYYILVLLEEELEMIGTIFFTASIIQYAIDISLNFKNNIKSSMRFLTKRTVVILVTVFIFISMAAGVIYFCAYKQAEDGAPLPTLYKRAKEQGSHFDTSYSKNYIGKFLLSIFMSEKKKLTPHILDMSLELGREFLLNNQKEEGSFTYKYNFITKKFSSSDSQVRQAGALWGLSLIHQDNPSTRTKEAILKGLDFFIDNSRETKDGRKYVVYPGFDKGYTGTVALLTLSLIDFLRVEDDPQLIKKYKVELSKYIKFLMSIMTNKKQFYGSYRFKDGTGFGAPSPYYDGETLLALIKAAKYLEFSELKYAITESAEAMYNRNIRDALELDPDSDITKGFYQWSSMAYYELYTTRWDDTEKYAKRVIDLAYWMIDVHQTLRRRKNTAYAHEGLIVAWEIARLNKDRFAMYKIGSVIDEGLYKLTSWQVEGPLENKFLRSHSTDDPVAIGGVMNSKSDSRLRIDVAQHQMHAVILARRYIYTDKDKK